MKRIRTYVWILLVSVALLAGCNKQQKEWTVTQYGFYDSSQFMFYTIQSSSGELIVIDGGWDVGADYVKSIIKGLGGTVDAWILTHPHPDHIGAFNEIYPDLDGIEIRQIYASEIDYEVYRERAQEWDGFESFETFLRVTEGTDRLTYLRRGDELSLCGLNMKVFNAYDEIVEELSQDVCNDGSLMFYLEGEENRMLFCADVGGTMSETILKQYGEDLKADYLQMAHHGQGGQIDEFYKRVSPAAAFFDAPNTMTYDTSGTYNTPGKIAMMQELGAVTYAFDTAPNTVILR